MGDPRRWRLRAEGAGLLVAMQLGIVLLHSRISARSDGDATAHRRLGEGNSLAAPQAVADCTELARLLGLNHKMLKSLEAELRAWRKSDGVPDEVDPATLVHMLGKDTSWLQPAFVRLHHHLFSRRLLPLSNFGEYRVRKARFSNMFDKTCISRRAFVLFNRREAHRVRAKSACLGWDTPAHAAQVPGCSLQYAWSFIFEPIPVPRIDVAKRQLHADLVALGRDAEANRTWDAAMPRFDLIVCNQVFEHVPQPFLAAKALYALLRPGGLVFWTAPFMERQHLQWDFFRYTASGARELMTSAGLEVVTQVKFGDTYLGSAYVMGFGIDDVDEDWLRSGSTRIFRETANVSENSREWLYTGTGMVARKPTESPSMPLLSITA